MTSGRCLEPPSEHRKPRRPNSFYQPRRKERIAILCLPGLETFLGDIVSFLESRYEVRTCYSRDGGELASAVEWADLVWLEWANELAVELTQKLESLRTKKVICRVHRYEVFRPFFKNIQWQYLDKVVFVAGFIRDLALQIVPDLHKQTSTEILHNGIHLERFRFNRRQPGYSLAVIGYIHSRKNPFFWPIIISKLKAMDRRYTLHVAGEFQEAECKLYLQQMINKLDLAENIKFHGYQKFIHQWLEDKDYLLATSVHESFGYTIGEAMAMGIRPVVHCFPGAEELWPKRCLFSSIEEAISMVRDKGNYDSLMYRSFVEKHYSLHQQLLKVDKLIAETLEEHHFQYSTIAAKQSYFSDTISYWEQRYSSGGRSGAGSYGSLAQFKAEFLNNFIMKKNINTVVEFGCGDGNQLSLINCGRYLGLDVSKTAILKCRDIFRYDKNKDFVLYDPFLFSNTYYNSLNG